MKNRIQAGVMFSALVACALYMVYAPNRVEAGGSFAVVGQAGDCKVWAAHIDGYKIHVVENVSSAGTKCSIAVN